MSQLLKQDSLDLQAVIEKLPDIWGEEVPFSQEKYRSFREYYFDKPELFLLNCVEWGDEGGPSDYQREMARNLPTQLRVAIRGPHGLGKTCISALLVLWYALTRDVDKDWKVVTTASSWRQLTKYLWPEIAKWSRKLKWEDIGREPFNNSEQFTLSIKLQSGEAFAVASSDSNRIEGAHADHIFYLFDESKTIPDPTWDSAEGAHSTGIAYWMAVSTPGSPLGRFYDIHSRKAGYHDWWARHVKRDEVIAAGRMDESWAENRKLQWGVSSAVYKNRVEGEFAAQESDSVIPLEWVEQAVERYHEVSDNSRMHATIDRIGVDVALSGKDETIFAFASGNKILWLEDPDYQETTAISGRVLSELRLHPQASAVIDVIGIGAGVYHESIEEQPERIIGFNAAISTPLLDRTGQWKFTNLRSAAWWFMRELLDPRNDEFVELPDDEDLIGELVTPTWRAVSGGRIQIEPKDQIKRRLGRSTNRADAVIQALWKEQVEYGIEYA